MSIEILTDNMFKLARLVELVGMATIFIGIVYSFIKFFLRFDSDAYVRLRQSLGKSILLGLEILIAADIMDTVNTEPTITSVLVLGMIVLIRTFMSLSLEVELQRRFPWQPKVEPKPEAE